MPDDPTAAGIRRNSLRMPAHMRKTHGTLRGYALRLRQRLVGAATETQRTAGGFPLAWPDPWRTMIMNTPHEHTATVELETSCPRCGNRTALWLPAACDQADAQRLSRLVLCDECEAWHGSHRDPEAEVRL